jgi:2-octaprenyl-6-methoxyphenol hydroxylase
LKLARAGFAVVLVGPDVVSRDNRTTALMAPALELLDQVGVLDLVRPHAQPLATMRIIDATQRLVRSPVVTFHASDIGELYFGLNIANRDLNAALEGAVRAEQGITWLRDTVRDWTLNADAVEALTAGAARVAAKLVVAADGRLSPARAAAGIPVDALTLPQAALVLTFRHSRPHGSISAEFHTETGPFTQVPLPGERSSLVWVTTPERAATLQTMPVDELSLLVEERMQSMLGLVELEGERQIFPLTASTPRRFADKRIALVGEAAHIFPPIGAQGLNLGLRDVADLSAIAATNKQDPGCAEAMRAYDAKRRPDILARATAVNLLNRSLLSDMLPAQIARSAGLGALRALSPLRTLFMREGMRPGSGFSAIFSDLREQIGR